MWAASLPHWAKLSIFASPGLILLLLMRVGVGSHFVSQQKVHRWHSCLCSSLQYSGCDFTTSVECEAPSYRWWAAPFVYHCLTHTVGGESFCLCFSEFMCFLRCLCRTMTYSILISPSSTMEFHAFSDTDGIGDLAIRHSTCGNCLFLGDSLISWQSKKQQME